MDILIIDRDETQSHLLKSRLEQMGHDAEIHINKEEAIERMKEKKFGIVFVDPSPLTTPRPLVVNIRRSVDTYPYIFLISHTLTDEKPPHSGVNDMMEKPIDMSVLKTKIENAERLYKLVDRIGDTSEDFPSAGGVIAKSAFNQLFISGIDRADRYQEKTYILFISFSNHDEVSAKDGPYASDFSIAKLSQNLVRIRRQSDIIGQTGKYQYALLMQRPLHEKEPIEAAGRFAEAIGKCQDICEGSTPVEVTVSLVVVPSGEEVVKHTVELTAK